MMGMMGDMMTMMKAYLWCFDEWPQKTTATIGDINKIGKSKQQSQNPTNCGIDWSNHTDNPPRQWYANNNGYRNDTPFGGSVLSGWDCGTTLLEYSRP